ncbi:MAG TPA: tetratricopeptide repeat protein [Planctomycetota bacterium]|nr:tetratricopeptide repeat protein [Planctomycetota bacterium]
MRVARSFVDRWVRPGLLPAIAVAWLVSAGVPGQEPGTKPPDAAIAQSVARLEEFIANAKALLESGDRSAARDVCKAALAAAALDDATPAWFAAADGALWRLGLAAYSAADLATARTAWEALCRHREATLPEDHADLQAVRLNLGAVEGSLGDLPGALELFEAVVASFSRTLPDDHPDLQRARSGLANVKRILGDLPGALALQEQVLAVRTRTLPDDHVDLQLARLNLGCTKMSLGDLPGAHELFDRVVTVFEHTLPSDHPRLQLARMNLATTKQALGDLPGALLLFEEVVAVFSRTLPDDHPDLQAARGSLAVVRKVLGDLPGALALEEQVLAVLTRTLPDDHPDLQAARGNLANTKHALGDLPGALALREKALEVLARTMPDDHPDLQRARAGLANTKRALGDAAGALALEERVLAVYERTLPKTHADLQAARDNLAVTKKALGDLVGARALQEEVLAVLSETLPDDHPDLQQVRANLANTRRALGDLPGALLVQQKVLAVLSETLPDDHPDLQWARLNLAATEYSLGDLPAAADLDRAMVGAALQRLSTRCVSTRDATELARQAAEPLSHVTRLLDLGERLPDETVAALRADGLQLLEATRSAELHTVRLRQIVREQQPEAFARLGPQLAEASQRLENAIAQPRDATESAEQRVSRDDAIRDATLAKDTLERELLALVPRDMRLAVRPGELAARLAAHEVAVAFLTYTRWNHAPDTPWIMTSEQRFGAFVLTASGRVTWHALAPVAAVDALIAGVRDDAIAGRVLAMRSVPGTPDLVPGRDPDVRPAPAATLGARLVALREMLFDPVLAALPEGTDSLVLSLADEMQLVPIDELPLASGVALGDAFAVSSVWSLRALMQPRVESNDAPSALVLGGADYDSEPGSQAVHEPGIATPILAPSPERAGPDGRSFAPLPGSKREAESLAAMFASAFTDRTATTLLGADASEARFVDAAPGSTFLHLATHGYFAPEGAWRATDVIEAGPLARFDAGPHDRAAQLSPYSLAGIVLAGANLPGDARGHHEGILTAQEIALLDLHCCRLATLSACETSLGVRRAGTGLASLRQALHAAGARFVLATLWRVDDAQAALLMADFYARLWQQRQEPRAALQAAKRAARQRGLAFRDWAGWALSGR